MNDILNTKHRPGIATVVLVIILVIIVAAAGAGAYALVLAAPGSAGTKTTHTIGTVTTTSALKTTTFTFTTGTTSGATGSQTYNGTFTYTTPLGPFGINDSSGKPVEWNSTQTATGSFTFSIDPATYLGTGSGQGDITVTTHGYCTGTATVPYTFAVQVAHPPGANFEIAFDTPTPSSVSVQLTCQGPTTGFNTANNPVTYLSVYPNGLSVASLPTVASQNLTGGISYTVTIT